MIFFDLVILLVDVVFVVVHGLLQGGLLNAEGAGVIRKNHGMDLIANPQRYLHQQRRGLVKRIRDGVHHSITFQFELLFLFHNLESFCHVDRH